VTVTRTAVPALLVAVLALGTACGGSDDPEAQPTDSPTSSPTTESTAPTEEPTETEGTAAPATGPALELPLSSVNAPEDWKVLDQLVEFQKDAGDDDTSSSITLSEIEAFSGYVSPEQLVKSWFKTSPYPLKPKVQPNVEIDDVEFYHLAGDVMKLNYLEEFGAVVQDKIVTVVFQFSPEVSPTERQEVVDSVMETFEFN
jgi:hypothetical protein